MVWEIVDATVFSVDIKLLTEQLGIWTLEWFGEIVDARVYSVEIKLLTEQSGI